MKRTASGARAKAPTKAGNPQAPTNPDDDLVVLIPATPGEPGEPIPVPVELRIGNSMHHVCVERQKVEEFLHVIQANGVGIDQWFLRAMAGTIHADRAATLPVDQNPLQRLDRAASDARALLRLVGTQLEASARDDIAINYDLAGSACIMADDTARRLAESISAVFDHFRQLRGMAPATQVAP